MNDTVAFIANSGVKRQDVVVTIDFQLITISGWSQCAGFTFLGNAAVGNRKIIDRLLGGFICLINEEFHELIDKKARWIKGSSWHWC